MRFDGEGVDVSSWQEEIDFGEVKAAGKRFVIVRGGDGRYRDSRRVEYAAGARANELGVDAYHFLRWSVPPPAMVGLCEESAEAIKSPHIWLDSEDTSPYFMGLTVEARVTWLLEVIERLDRVLPNDDYTGGWWWRPYMGDSDCCSKRGRYVWSAEYPFMNSMQAHTWLLLPSLYGGWTRTQLAVWQYGSQGRIQGVGSTFTDLDWAYVPIPIQKQEEDEDMPIIYRAPAEPPDHPDERHGLRGAAGLDTIGDPADLAALVAGGAKIVDVSNFLFDEIQVVVNRNQDIAPILARLDALEAQGPQTGGIDVSKIRLSMEG